MAKSNRTLAKELVEALIEGDDSPIAPSTPGEDLGPEYFQRRAAIVNRSSRRKNRHGLARPTRATG